MNDPKETPLEDLVLNSERFKHLEDYPQMIACLMLKHHANDGWDLEQFQHKLEWYSVIS